MMHKSFCKEHSPEIEDIMKKTPKPKHQKSVTFSIENNQSKNVVLLNNKLFQLNPVPLRSFLTQHSQDNGAFITPKQHCTVPDLPGDFIAEEKTDFFLLHGKFYKMLKQDTRVNSKAPTLTEKLSAKDSVISELQNMIGHAKHLVSELEKQLEEQIEERRILSELRSKEIMPITRPILANKQMVVIHNEILDVNLNKSLAQPTSNPPTPTRNLKNNSKWKRPSDTKECPHTSPRRKREENVRPVSLKEAKVELFRLDEKVIKNYLKGPASKKRSFRTSSDDSPLSTIKLFATEHHTQSVKNKIILENPLTSNAEKTGSPTKDSTFPKPSIVAQPSPSRTCRSLNHNSTERSLGTSHPELVTNNNYTHLKRHKKKVRRKLYRAKQRTLQIKSEKSKDASKLHGSKGANECLPTKQNPLQMIVDNYSSQSETYVRNNSKTLRSSSSISAISSGSDNTVYFTPPEDAEELRCSSPAKLDDSIFSESQLKKTSVILKKIKKKN